MTGNTHIRHMATTAFKGRGYSQATSMPLRLLAVLFALTVTVAALPQPSMRTVKGTVADAKTGEGVAYVTCKSLDAADSLLAYTMTAGDGTFNLPLPNGTATVEFTLIGYDKKRVRTPEAGLNMHVSLTPSAIMLKELTVKALPIERRQDTINYNVAAFQGKEDRYIEDVLRKLLGVEVAADGSVSYNGKSINKFNIEGQDLLGNQYNQATRNLPADAVATVQIMENDQPVRALKDRVPSDKATLNIKLKQDYRLHPFGEASGCIGGFDGVSWDNRLTLVNIGRKNQIMLTARMDNSGVNLSGNTVEHFDASDPYNYEPLPPDMTAVGGTSKPPVSEKRYLRNKSYSVGLNMLRRVGRYGSLRANLSYYGTSDRSRDSTFNFYGGEHTLSLYETSNCKTRRHTFMPRVQYELNSPGIYLVDEVSGSLTAERLSCGMMTEQYAGTKDGQPPTGGATGDSQAAASRLGERTVRHPGYVQNKLRMTVNAGANTYSVNSLVRYFRRSETLGVDYGGTGNQYVPAGNEARQEPATGGGLQQGQRITLERLMARSSAGTRFYIGANSLEARYAFELRNDKVEEYGGGSFNTTYMKHSLTPEYVVRYGRGHVTTSLPVNVFTQRVPWSSAGGKTEIYLSPDISWRHEFSPMWRLNVSGGTGLDESDEVMAGTAYYSGYRTRVTTPDHIGMTRSTRTSLSLRYADMVSMFVWNFMAMASWSRADHYNEYSYGEGLTTVSPVWENADIRSLYVMTSADKTVSSAGLAVKGTLNYNRTVAPVAQNGRKINVTGNVFSAAMTLRWDKLDWITVAERPTFNLTWQDLYDGSTGNNVLANFYNEADLHLFPFKGLEVSVSWEYNMLEVERGRYRHNSFIDASAHYAPTKKVELGLTVNNLLDRKVYEEASFTGMNYNYFSLPLRGREIMLSVTFNI